MIGFIDSGVGGLTILREVQRLLPTADVVYFGDTANVPYGGRTDDDIRRLSLAAVDQVMRHHPDLVVVACNTATSVAIHDIRAAHPNLPIVGVVPVLKTAAEKTQTKRVAVIATQATLTSRSYQELKARFASGVAVFEHAAPEWVTLTEAGRLSGPDVDQSVENVATGVRAFGADVVALGCTHFPFLRPVLQRCLPDVRILDSGPAVARQVVRVLTNNRRLPSSTEQGTVTFESSGDQRAFVTKASQLLASLS